MFVPLNPGLMPKVTIEQLRNGPNVVKDMNPNDFKLALNVWMRKVVGLMGFEAARIARAAILGGPLGSAVASRLPVAHAVTILTRRRSKRAHPLMDTGKLGKSIGYKVISGGGGDSFQVALGAGGVYNDVLSMLETGYKIRPTGKMLRFFTDQRDAFYNKFSANKGRDQLPSGAFLNPSAGFAKQGAGWAGLASWARKALSGGANALIVAPRPVLAPAMLMAIDKVSKQIGPLYDELFAVWLGSGPKRLVDPTAMDWDAAHHEKLKAKAAQKAKAAATRKAKVTAARAAQDEKNAETKAPTPGLVVIRRKKQD